MEIQNKKVLILAYDFPPYVSVGGLRPYNWYKYLHEFEIHPVVITRQWSNDYGNHLDYVAPSEKSGVVFENSDLGTIIRTPYFPNLSNRMLLKGRGPKIVRKLITAYFEFVQFCFNVGPKKEFYKASKKYLDEYKVDAIIATGDPFVLFKYASKLSEEYSIPWIADYRDLWSQGPDMINKPIFKRWSQFFEKRILKSASNITTVSEFLRANISEVAPKDAVISIVTNGFDAKFIEQVIDTPQQKEILSIGYAGTIYAWHPLNSFLVVVDEFIKQHGAHSLRVNFYGSNMNDQIAELIERDFPNLKDSIIVNERLPNDELLPKLAENNIMLLFNDYYFLGTKIYDYIGVERTVLLCYSEDPESEELKNKHYRIAHREGLDDSMQITLIEKMELGSVAKNQADLKNILEQYYLEFQKNGYISFESLNTDEFTRKRQTKKLADLINGI